MKVKIEKTDSIQDLVKGHGCHYVTPEGNNYYRFGGYFHIDEHGDMFMLDDSNLPFDLDNFLNDEENFF